MSNEASVTLWINAVRQGDSVAAQNLWQRYFPQLMANARSRMGGLNRGAYDEEDVALSTFRIICSKLQNGEYTDLADRNELWRLMMTILARKIVRRRAYQRAAKRNDAMNAESIYGIESLPSNNQISHVELSQECYELIQSLKDPNLERVALLKFEGFTNAEIACELNRTHRTVQRMLNLIRNIWQEALDLESSD